MDISGLVLADLGVDTTAEIVYGELLDHPRATLPGIAVLTGLGRRRVAAACATLEDRGLVSRSSSRPTRYFPTPPDVAVEALVLQQRESLERARLGAATLVERYRRGAGTSGRSDEFVEVIAGGGAIAQRFRQLQRAAKEEMLLFDKPPYVVSSTANESTELDALKRGVAVRVVYDTTSLTVGEPEEIQRLITAGEQARTMPDVPIKLVIADRRLGLVPLRQNDPGLEGRLLIHESPLLDALIMLFEALWERATPLRPGSAQTQGEPGRGELAVDDRTLLLLLAAGLKDQAIARQLRVTERTVTRRLQRLFKSMGAQTRFQAGLIAARLRWLE